MKQGDTAILKMSFDYDNIVKITYGKKVIYKDMNLKEK